LVCKKLARAFGWKNDFSNQYDEKVLKNEFGISGSVQCYKQMTFIYPNKKV